MKIANRLLDNIKHIDDKEYTYISVRLKPEYYYMLDLISYLNKKPISSILTDEIQNYLFDVLCFVLLSDSNKEESKLKLVSDIRKISDNSIYYNLLRNNCIITK